MIQPKLPVFFHFTDTSFHFPKRTLTKQAIVQLVQDEGADIQEINYIFCSDLYLLEINKQYLDHDTFTDIITFPYHNDGAPIHSDVYISIDRIRENGKSYGVALLHELHRVLFHGALHLCGYKDKTTAQVKLMRSKEEFYLNRFFVSRETKRD